MRKNRGMLPFLRETFPVGLLACNCTLLGDPTTGEAIVIDPGLPMGSNAAGGPAHLLARLRAHGLRLTHILITHAHIDHVGGALALKQATGAPIVMHQADLPLLKAMDLQADWLGVAAPPVASPDASAEDGLGVQLGPLYGEVLHTPGHTPGSVCLLFPQINILFAGDTLFAGAIGRTDLPLGDGALLLRSIRDRLLPLHDELIVVPGHGEMTTIGAERAGNPFLQRLR